MVERAAKDGLGGGSRPFQGGRHPGERRREAEERREAAPQAGRRMIMATSSSARSSGVRGPFGSYQRTVQLSAPITRRETRKRSPWTSPAARAASITSSQSAS